MDKFKNTLRVPTSRIKGPDALPISEGFNYFDTERGILYRDENGRRFALANVFKVDNLNLAQYISDPKKLLNSIVINEDTSNDTFQMYYVNEDGAIVLLDSGGGDGVIYSAGDGISFSPENIISVNSTVVRWLGDPNNPYIQFNTDWIIQNEQQDFVIKEVNNSQNIITIYKQPQTSGGVTDAKVDINAKTVISELDFGGW